MELTGKYVKQEFNRQNIERYKGKYEFHRWFNIRSNRESYKMHYRSLLHHTNELEFNNYLEIGPGPGTWTKLFLNEKASFTLLDISEEMLKQAMDNLGDRKNITYINKDFENFNSSKKFDFILGVRTIKYMPHKEIIFKNIYQALKDDGTGIIVNQSADSLIQRILSLLKKKPKRLLHSGNISLKELKRIMIKTGFNNIKVYPVAIKVGILHLLTIYSLSWFLWKLFYQKPLNWFSSLFTTTYLIKFRK